MFLSQPKYKLINLSLYSLYYAETCNESAGPISVSLHLQATQLLLNECRSAGNTVSDLTCQRFEQQTSRTRDERATSRPTAG